MTGACPLCGYIGELNQAAKSGEIYTCLSCYDKFYCNKIIETQTEEDIMSWDAVSGKSEGGKKNPDVLDIAPNTTKLVHVLLPDNEEPVSYWTHYIPNKSAGGRKGTVVICPGRDICPACSMGIFRTKRVHAINVWDYESKSVKILEGGNSIFQALKQVKDQIGTLLNVDFSIKRIGSGKDTQYSTIPIPMMKPFDQTQVHGLFPIVNLRLPPTVEEAQKEMGEMGYGSVPTTQTTQAITGGAVVSTLQAAVSVTGIEQATYTKPTLPFGKYKGRTVEDIYTEDPNYIKWCADNISDIKIKTEAKRVIEAANKPQTAPTGDGILSEDTTRQLLTNDINEILQEDERYKGNFALILEKMKSATISPTHPNGKTILGEYTTEELKTLEKILK